MGIDISVLASPTPGSIAGPTLDSVTGLVLGFVTSFAPDSVTGPAPGVVAGHVAPVVRVPIKGNYFHEKQVMVQDFTSSKQYIKGTIWIVRIVFREISEA